MSHPDSDFSRTKWDRKYADSGQVSEQPSAVLCGLSEWIPETGRAINVAGGGGRNAIWLAERGLAVTLADISTVGLQLAERRAADRGVSLATREFDLEQGRFPAGPWDLVFVHLFLWRPLFAKAAEQLAEGGCLVVIQPTESNLERHSKPPAPFLLKDGELAKLIAECGLQLRLYRESWDADGRFDAVAVAEKP